MLDYNQILLSTNFASTWLLSDHDDFNLSTNILSERSVFVKCG